MAKYEYVSEDDKSFTIKHPEGNEFKVAKTQLNEQLIKKINALKPKKMAEGGIVTDPFGKTLPGPYDDIVNPLIGDKKNSSSEQDASIDPGNKKFETDPGPSLDEVNGLKQKYLDSLHTYQNSKLAEIGIDESGQTPDRAPAMAKGPPNRNARMDAMAAEVGSPPNAGPTGTPDYGNNYGPQMAPAAPQATPGMPSAMGIGAGMMVPGAYQKAFAAQAAGINMGAAAQAQQGKDVQQAYGQYEGQMAQVNDQYNQQRQKLQAEQDELYKNLQSQKVDPNRMWNNMSTGNKVMATVGVLLSGLGGGGANGNPNLALNVIQKRVNEDIDAQKSNIDQGRNLLSANLQKYRNMEAAEVATRLQLNTALQSQLAIAAAKSQSAMAKSQSVFMIGELGAKQAQLQHELALMNITAQAKGAGGQGGLPNQQANMLGVINPKMAEVAVPVGGKTYFANSADDAKKMKEIESSAGPVLSMVKQLNDMGPDAVIPGSTDNLRAQAIRGKLAVAIPRLSGLNRLNEKEIEESLKTIKDPTSLKQLVNGNAINNQFFRNIKEAVDAERKTYLPGYKSSEEFGFKPAQE